MIKTKSVSYSLFFIRITVFLVFLIWSVDKLLRPEHAGAVFSNFYFISNLPHLGARVLGVLQLLLSLAFLAGFQKRITYGLVFILHLISTVSSYQQYFAPFESANILFFAAWPMLAACWILYVLRDMDTIAVVKQ